MNVSLHAPGQLSDNVTSFSWHMWPSDNDYLQVFQLLELPAETQKLETHQALLLTQRALLLQSIYNSSSDLDPGDNVTAFKEVMNDNLMRTKHQVYVRRISPRLWTGTRRYAARPPLLAWTSWARTSPTTGTTSSPASSPSPSWPQSVCFLILPLKLMKVSYGYGELFEGMKIVKDYSNFKFAKSFILCRLWQLCSGDIWGQIFLSVFRHYRNPFHVVGSRRCRRNIRGNPPIGLGQKQDEDHSDREETAPS